MKEGNGDGRERATNMRAGRHFTVYQSKKKLTHVVVAVLNHSDKECEWGKLPGPRVLDHHIDEGFQPIPTDQAQRVELSPIKFLRFRAIFCLRSTT